MTPTRGRGGARPPGDAAPARVAKADRVKVVVVGGGMGGLTAAYELSHPRHGGKYEITVYQMGWRLGGKGASGRNRDKSDRIEEHGLHVWMGFYENAFRMMRECYEELGMRAGKQGKRSQHAFATIEEAFLPDHHVGVACPPRQAGDPWLTWTAWFPPMDGQPGDPLKGDRNPFTLNGYLTRSIFLARTLMLSLVADAARRDGKRSAVDDALDKGRRIYKKRSPKLLVDAMARMLRVGTLTTLSGLAQAVLILETALRDRMNLAGKEYFVLEFLDAVVVNVRRQLQDVVGIDPEIRRKTELVDLVMTSIAGILRDELLAAPNGLDAIDHLDAREWLARHGATWSSLNSPILRGLYDMAFAEFIPMEESDRATGRSARRGQDGELRGLSAGQALRCAMRMFYTYRGSLFWRMRSAMGEVVFAPLYDLLKARGVEFEFFHCLDAIEVDTTAGSRFVKGLTFLQQAKTNPRKRYEPLVEVDTAVGKVRAWPAEPLWDQLAGDGNRGRNFEVPWDRAGQPRNLEAGKDFHMVVLAVGLGAIPHILGYEKLGPRWQDMVQRMRTVPTQAMQVWLGEPMHELGWRAPPVTLSGIGPTGSKTFDTWSDMTPIIPLEHAKLTEDTPSALAYFCGAMRDAELDELHASRVPDGQEARANKTIERVRQQVRANGTAFLAESMGDFWPDAREKQDGNRPEGRFDWRVLHVPQAGGRRTRKASYDAQYYTAAVAPSDRYVLSVPGSAAYRISPLDDSIVNLTVAGDWTACGFLGGCIEAAVMSGRLAAHALSGLPALDEIIGYDHP